MINILIPLAGKNTRFIKAGFTIPKPIIDIFGKPMVCWAVDTLGIEGRKIFIIRKEHVEFGLKDLLRKLYDGCIVIDIDYYTDGPAQTALLAKTFIDNMTGLIIANCDQIMEWDAIKFINYVESTMCDGAVVTYYATTDKNSYVRLNEMGLAVEFAEKKAISTESLNGVHYWRHGKDFVRSAEAMIMENKRSNNEFYVAPTYNYLIKEGKNIRAFHIGVEQHHAVGTPEDLEAFISYWRDR